MKRIFSENKVFINGALFALFSFVNKGFVFILLLLLANFITPAEYGSLNLFNTVTMVVSYFVAMSSEGYWSVSFYREGKSGLRKTFSSILFITIIVSSLLVFFLAIEGEYISENLSLPVNVLFFGISICFFTVYNNLLLDHFRLQERVLEYGVVCCGNALLNFVLSIVLVKCFMLSWYGRVYAQVISSVIFGSIGIIYLIRQSLLTSYFISQLKPLLLWSIPIIPHLASNFIRQGCDRYIINKSYSIEEVGLFGFALNIANIITMIGLGFNQSNSVDIYKTLGDAALSKEEKLLRISKQRKLFSMICLICTIIIGITGYILIPVFLPEYEKSINYFLILTAFAFFSCLYFLWTNYLYFYKKTKKIMYVTFATSILHLFLSLTLTPINLYLTAVIYTISQIIIVIFIRHLAKKVLAENL